MGDALLLPPPSRPMAVAREVLKQLYTLPAGLLLRSHRGDFFLWSGVDYPEIHRRDVQARVYSLLEHATFQHDDGSIKPFAPTQRKVADVMEALGAITLVESRLDAPAWIDHRPDPRPDDLIAFTNGLLQVSIRKLWPHATAYFNHHALPFAYEISATMPDRWLTFLRELWPDDPSTIATLQEVFGYVIGGDTRQQKIFLMVGPKRGGKGTIGRVLTGLLGLHHVAAPTLASLSTNFGLQPLIGKPLALISDARLSTRADTKIVVERLLSISGEDSLTIDRKYRDPWTGRLPTRFLIMTNELPRLSDASGALASRFVPFVGTKSFYGCENPQLTTELLAEAPAILNWALEGLDRLSARGYFEQPKSGADAIRQMEDLASPIAAFVRDCCVVRRDAVVDRDTLWTAWKAWCLDTNSRLSTKAVFGRDLHAVVPVLKDRRPGTETRLYRYEGIGLQGEYSAELPGRLGRNLDQRPGRPGNSGMYPSRESDDDDQPSHDEPAEVGLNERLRNAGDARFKRGWK